MIFIKDNIYYAQCDTCGRELCNDSADELNRMLVKHKWKRTIGTNGNFYYCKDCSKK